MVETARAERLLTGHTGRLLVATSIGWFAIQGGRLVLSPLLTAIQADLGIGPFRAGIAFSVLWGLYALIQYPSGRLSDTLTRKTVIVAGLLAASVGFLLLGAAPSYPLFLVGASILGVGAGLYPTATRALLSDLFVERRGQAFGLHQSSGDVGGIVASGVATVILAVTVWRAAFTPVVILLLGSAVAIYLWGSEGIDLDVEGPDLAVRATAGRIFGDPNLRWLLFAYSLFAVTWQAAVAFLPTYLKVTKGFDPAVANAAFAVLFGVGAVVKPVAGGVSDYLPRAVLASGALALGGGALVVVIVASTPLVVIAAVAVFAVGLMGYPPVMQSYLMDIFPDESQGGDLGAMRTVYIGIGALGPTYAGVVAETLNYSVAFVGLVVALAASAIVIALRGSGLGS